MSQLDKKPAANKTVFDGATPEGRRLLLANGFEPVILNGKAPVSKGWQHGEITAGRLAAWETENPNGGNTGLRCGKLAVVDIDLKDSAHAETVADAVEGILGVTDAKRYGRKGVALCYGNAETSLRKISITGRLPGEAKSRLLVEVLGQGQQVAAFGPHPDTGKPYLWPSGSPLETSLEELEQVNRADIRRAVSFARDALEELGFEKLEITGDLEDSSREIQPATDGAPVTAAMLESMLSHVDPGCDRLTWISIAGAITSAAVVDETGEDDPDFDGAELFDRWSSGDLNPEHEPGNYVGRGDCDKAFDSVTASRPGGSGIGSIVELAREGGYAGPVRAHTAGELAYLKVPAVCAIERLRGIAKAANDDAAATGGGVSGGEIPDDNELPVNRWPSLIYRGDSLASIKPPVPLIAGYLLSRGVTALLAPRRSGKTIVALDLGLCLATDSEWAGEPVAPGWHVVYLCGEDAENAAAHVQAWGKEHNGGEVPDRFTFVRDVPDLLSHGNHDVVSLTETLCECIPAGARVLWIVDTWQRATTGGGQNEDSDMKSAFRNLEALANSHNGAAIGCFHPPKGDSRTIAGVMFQENAAVAMLQVEKVDPEKPDSERKLTVANIKGRGEGNFKRFRFREVEIGEPDSTFGQRPVGVIAEHVGGTGESKIVKLERERQERAEADKLAADTLALVSSLLADGWRVLGSNRGGGVRALKPSDIAKRLKVRPEKVEEALARLVADGRLAYREGNSHAKASYFVPE